MSKLDRSRSAPLGAFLSGCVVLVASWTNLLNHHDYPLLSAEALLGVAGLVLLAAAAAVAYRLSRGPLRAFLTVVLALIALDLNFNGLIPVAAGALAGAVLLGDRLVPALGVVFAVVLAGEVAGAAAGSEAPPPEVRDLPRGDGPPVLHLVLDEHIGLDGLPAKVPEARALRDDLLTFYEGNGFRVFGKAYSRRASTVPSLLQVLNLDYRAPAPDDVWEGMEVEPNRYFDALRGHGYRIVVYQSDVLGYCTSSAVAECRRYVTTSVAPVHRAALALPEKLKVLLSGFWALSDSVFVLSEAYDKGAKWAARHGVPLPYLALDSRRRTSALVTLEVLDELAGALRRARRGEVHFAHLMLPHYPYSLDAGCRIKESDDWVLRRDLRHAWARRYAAYAGQVRCTTALIDGLLDALAESPAGAEAIVIIHGDHGSRITRVDPVPGSGYGPRDLIDAYSTLFAVKAPAIAPGYDPRAVPLDALVKAVAESRFTTAEPALDPGFTPAIEFEH